MKALEFLVWLRDEVKCMPRSKEGTCTELPSNGELRRWIDKGVILVNGKRLEKGAEVTWPIEQLVFFPKNDKQRCTIF